MDRTQLETLELCEQIQTLSLSGLALFTEDLKDCMHGHVEYAAHIQIVQVYRSIELFVNFSIFFLFLVHVHTVADKSKWPGPASLETLACRVFAENVPFEAASHYKATKQATLCTPLPEDSQLSIAYLSFPTNESDLRLYSNLSNGSSKEFRRGQTLVGQVRNVFQIGMCCTEGGGFSAILTRVLCLF